MMPRALAQYGRPGSDAFPATVRDIAASVASDAFDFRVTVQRDMSDASDDWGQPTDADWQDHIVDMPCLIATTAAGKELLGDPRQGMTLNRWRLIFKLDTDITSRDRITNIRDERGNVIAPGPLNMIGPVYRRAAYAEVEIEQVS